MTARDSLEQMLDLLFGAKDLRRFVETDLGRSNPEALASAIQWDQGDSGRGASNVVEALELRGAVDDAFFDRLLEAFPERVSDIEEVARQCLPHRAVGASPSLQRSRPMPVAPPESGVWDVFLAHAGPDGTSAEELYEILVERGWSVFLDSRCVQLGERWDDVIPAALDASRLVVVLVSTRTRKAWYAREEIALAIDASRRRGDPARVVPVYLDPMPEAPAEWLYGLRRLQGMVAADVGWPQGVTDRLVARLDPGEPQDEPRQEDRPASSGEVQRGPNPRQSERPEVPAAPPPTTALHYLHLAMDLDRSEQWLALVQESRSKESGIFLLYGERRQNLELFAARLYHYLAEETALHHRIIEVPERWEMELARSGAAWEIHLRRAFQSGRGTAADLLAEAARHGPVILLIGRHPLSRDGLDEDEETIAALEEFLEDRLPALLKRCPGPHPVRALLATDYERPEESLERRLYAKIQRGAERHGIRCRRLPEVQHVQWSHIKGYLDGLQPAPPSAVYKTLEREYQRLDHGRVSFRDLAERLSRRL